MQLASDDGTVSAPSIEPQYWIDIFTTDTWNEFRQRGSTTAAFGSYHERTVMDRVQIGDILLCYITGQSVFVGALQVVGAGYTSTERISETAVFPCRLPVKLLVEIPAEEGVSIKALASRFSFTAAGSAKSWIGKVRRTLTRWAPQDAAIVLLGLRRRVASLKANGVSTDPSLTAEMAEQMWEHLGTIFKGIPPAQLKAIEENWDVQRAEATALVQPAADAASPPSYEIEGARVTIPEDDAEASDAASVTEHSKIQALLARIGAKMGLQIWIATNDRSRVVDGAALKDYAHVVDTLPTQFDEIAMKTAKLIDVLWIQRRTIVAAFEIESTTSVFSGLLRMSDMIAMVPNVSMPLFIVAPAARRAKVTTEINRPSFALTENPMVEVCRLITFEDLRDWYERAGDFIEHMRPQALDDIAQYCEAD